MENMFSRMLENLFKRFDHDLSKKEEALTYKLEIVLAFLQKIRRKRIDKNLDLDKQFLERVYI